MQHRVLAYVPLLAVSFLGACAGAGKLQSKDEVNSMGPSSVVQRQLDAYNSHDLPAFLATYSEDVVLYRVPATTPAIRGKQQLSDFYRTSRFNLPNLHAELLHRTVVGDKIIDHEKISGLRSQPVEAVAAYVVREGLIQSVWLFYPE
jgi:hypothetical protein